MVMGGDKSQGPDRAWEKDQSLQRERFEVWDAFRVEQKPSEQAEKHLRLVLGGV